MNKVIALFLTLGITIEGFADLPAPLDLGPAPVAESPGGNGLPVMKGKAAPGAPELGAGMESVLADETLSFTGTGLAGASLRVWWEGGVSELEPLRSRGDCLQAILPKTAPASTLLIWPEKGGLAGTPIRLNGATLWWAWPRQIEATADNTVRLFGKHLTLGEHTPVVILETPEGRREAAEIVKAQDTHLEVRLPEELTPGTLTAWAHNGTGGKYGWSDPVSIEVKAAASPLREFVLEDYDVPKDGRSDCSEAFIAAIADCVEAGGGVIRLGRGAYILKTPVVLPAGVPIVLRGAGMGSYEAKTDSFGDEESEGTLVTDWLAGPKPNQFTAGGNTMITLTSPGQRIEDLTLRLVADVSPVELDGAVVRVHGPETALVRTRLVSHHMGTCSVKIGSGVSDLRMEGCEFYFAGPGVTVEDYEIAPPTYLRFADCVFRGSFRVGRGVIADALRLGGVARVIVERCDFSSVDRAHGRLLSRSFISGGGGHHHWLAGNRSHDVGAHPSVPAIDKNISEQYLYHRTLDDFPASVTSADATTLRFALSAENSTATIRGGGGTRTHRGLPDATRIATGQWGIFITRGKGLGQWRIVKGLLPDGGYELERPWRIVPAGGNLLVITRMNYQNVITGNFISPGVTAADIQPLHKNTGIFLHHQSFDNLITGNTLKNLGQALAVGHDYHQPSAWNLFEGNRIENVAGMAGGTSSASCFYTERLMRPPPSAPYTVHAYGIGNVFRRNTGKGAEDAAGVIGYSFADDRRYPSAYTAHEQSGILMSVIEHNDLTGAGEGLILTEPLNWPVVRRNQITTTEARQPAVQTRAADGMIAPYLNP